MIISIASGKGGTGKTTVSVNLAASIEEDVQVLDCDVEEPNAHLFLNPLIEKQEKAFKPVPLVDESRCTRCGKCAEICQFKAIVLIGGGKDGTRGGWDAGQHQSSPTRVDSVLQASRIPSLLAGHGWQNLIEEPFMTKILMVASENGNLSALGLALSRLDKVQVSRAVSGREALEAVKQVAPALIVSDEKLTDMTGLELARKVLDVNYMVNFAVVSPLSEEDFHEDGEGLGIMLQLPANPDASHADRVMDRLQAILGLSA